MQIHCSAPSVILNVTATQYTRSLKGIYHPTDEYNEVFMHGHSSPLSLAARLHRCHANHSRYSNNGWTFPDRPHIYNGILVTCTEKETLPRATVWMDPGDIMLSEVSQRKTNTV